MMKNLFLSLILLSSTGFAYAKKKDIVILEIPPTKNNELTMHAESILPEFLYKVVSPESWQDSLLQDHVITSSMDMSFIHLSTEEQLPRITQKFWADKEYVILKLFSKDLIGRVAYETNPGGNAYYYHLYDGKIPLNAVADVSQNLPSNLR